MPPSATGKDDYESILLDFSVSYSRELASKMARLDALIGDRHWLTVGTYKEDLLRNHLRSKLPKRFEVGTGFIVWQRGGKRVLSKQLDIVIWDAVDHMPLFRDGDFVVLFPEACKAVIEVKGKLSRGELRGALAALDSVVGFYDLHGHVGPESFIYRAVFAYQLGADLQFPEGCWDILHDFYATSKSWPLSERIGWTERLHSTSSWALPWADMVCVLETGAINLQQWGINKAEHLAYPAYMTAPSSAADDSYGFLERDLLATLISKNHRRWLHMERPGSATALLTPRPAFPPGSAFMLVPDVPVLGKIGRMNDADSAALAARRYSPKPIRATAKRKSASKTTKSTGKPPPKP